MVGMARMYGNRAGRATSLCAELERVPVRIARDEPLAKSEGGAGERDEARRDERASGGGGRPSRGVRYSSGATAGPRRRRVGHAESSGGFSVSYR